jgi:AcrR family transcriptional regulator
MTPRDERPSRRERPAKPALTRDGIVRAALAIARADGLEKVTMRRVAEQLDTGAASLYVYVRNTADLRAAMLDEILAAVDLSPATAAGPWRQRLAEVLTSYSMVLFANPALAQSAMTSRPSGPNYLNLIECLLTLLKAGGVPDGQAAWGVDLLMLYATGIAAEQGALSGRAESHDEYHALVAALRGADPARHPEIARLAEDLVSGGDRLTWGFQAVIAGIAATPRGAS